MAGLYVRADYGPMFVCGPITALAAVSPQRKVTIFGRPSRQALAVDARRLAGVRNPLAFRERGTLISRVEIPVTSHAVAAYHTNLYRLDHLLVLAHSKY